MRTESPRSDDGLVTELPESDDVLLSVVEAAAVLHVSRATLFRLLKDDEFPSIKLGKSRRIRSGALRAYVRAQECAERGAA